MRRGLLSRARGTGPSPWAPRERSLWTPWEPERRAGLGLVHTRDHRADEDVVAVACEQFGHHSAHRGGDVGRDLVGLQLEQGLIDGDRVARLDVPGADGALGDGLTTSGMTMSAMGNALLGARGAGERRLAQRRGLLHQGGLLLLVDFLAAGGWRAERRRPT